MIFKTPSKDSIISACHTIPAPSADRLEGWPTVSEGFRDGQAVGYPTGPVVRRARLGGLLSYYHRQAA
jgi:hypothetical protein